MFLWSILHRGRFFSLASLPIMSRQLLFLSLSNEARFIIPAVSTFYGNKSLIAAQSLSTAEAHSVFAVFIRALQKAFRLVS